VTQQYVQRRRREILDAAWACFARDGFHATTMDDVIATAGVSSSVVYRWFRGKDELVAACVAEAVQGGVDELELTLRVDPPVPLADAVERVVTAMLARTVRGDQDLSALAIQAWTEALRIADIHDLVGSLYGRIRAGLADLIRRHVAAGTAPPEIDPEAAAQPLFALIPGFLVQRLLLGAEDPHDYARAAASVLRV
jgi:AcrR family transcriptional regulator